MIRALKLLAAGVLIALLVGLPVGWVVARHLYLTWTAPHFAFEFRYEVAVEGREVPLSARVPCRPRWFGDFAIANGPAGYEVDDVSVGAPAAPDWAVFAKVPDLCPGLGETPDGWRAIAARGWHEVPAAEPILYLGDDLAAATEFWFPPEGVVVLRTARWRAPAPEETGTAGRVDVDRLVRLGMRRGTEALVAVPAAPDRLAGGRAVEDGGRLVLRDMDQWNGTDFRVDAGPEARPVRLTGDGLLIDLDGAGLYRRIGSGSSAPARRVAVTGRGERLAAEVRVADRVGVEARLTGEAWEVVRTGPYFRHLPLDEVVTLEGGR